MNNNVKFLEGEKIYLRSLQKEDLNNNYLQWLNDVEVCRFNSHAIFPNTEAKMLAYFESSQNNKQNVVLAIIDKQKNQHIGNVSLQNINWVSRSAEFAILIGDKNYWKGGYGTEASKLIVAYGFERLNLHRIYCGTLEGNTGMKRLAGILKMEKEGVRKEAIYKEGKYHDIVEYGVLKNRYLEQL